MLSVRVHRHRAEQISAFLFQKIFEGRLHGGAFALVLLVTQKNTALDLFYFREGLICPLFHGTVVDHDGALQEFDLKDLPYQLRKGGQRLIGRDYGIEFGHLYFAGGSEEITSSAGETLMPLK